MEIIYRPARNLGKFLFIYSFIYLFIYYFLFFSFFFLSDLLHKLKTQRFWQEDEEEEQQEEEEVEQIKSNTLSALTFLFFDKI